jgi:tRNA threonylcarbamoyladenosine biosynthesis protein TsaB
VARHELILGFDTSHAKGSVAVVRGKEILCEILFDAADTHSATLMPAIDSALEIAGTDVSSIDLFAVTIGPGSFTGLRIGLATVKGFAAVKHRPVVTMTSLELLAAAFPYSERIVCPVIDAYKGEVYAALYDTRSGAPVELVPPLSSKPEAAGALLRDHGPLILCGTGLARYGGLLLDAAPEGSGAVGARWSIPSAGLLALRAADLEPVDYDELPSLEPLYIRPPDAKLPPSAKLRRGGDGK